MSDHLGKLRLIAVGSTVVVICGLAATAASARAGAGSVFARQSASPALHRLTWADLGRMSPVQVGALQSPLLTAIAPVDALGQTAKWSGLFGGMALDTPVHLVDLYVTDTARATLLLAAAKKADRSLNLSVFRVFRTRYSLAQYQAAARRLLGASREGRLPFRVYSVGMEVPSRTLQVSVSDPRADQLLARSPLARLGGRSVSGIAGASLKFEPGSASPATSRETDSAPYIGGDYLGVGTTECTAGIPVENTSTKDDYLITAAHCFAKGDTVFTDTDHTVGKVTVLDDANNGDDAELINTDLQNGAGSNADEGEYDKGADGIQYYPLVGTASFAENEIIFQDGISTFFHRCPKHTSCPNGGVQKDFTIGDASWGISGANGSYYAVGFSSRAYSVQTCDSTHPLGCAAIGGDSGAVVFIYNGGKREALGMASGGFGGTDCTPALGHFCTGMWFTSALAIYHDTITVLNPHT